jgi:hypothetical protein
MKLLIAIVAMTVLASCGKDAATGNAPVPTPTVTPVSLVTLTPTPSPTATPTPVPTVSLRVYSRTVTLATSGPASIQGTGSCVVYQSVTYCWDDGIKMLNGQGFQYWGLEAPLTVCPNFSGGCIDDLLVTPRTMSANVIAALDTNAGTPSIYRTVNQVLTSGIFVDTDCTEKLDGTVDCGNFVIDTNQVPL